MDEFIKDEEKRLNWLRSRILQASTSWIAEKPEELENIREQYVISIINRTFNFEIDYLHNEPEAYLETYGRDLFGDEWSKMFE